MFDKIFGYFGLFGLILLSGCSDIRGLYGIDPPTPFDKYQTINTLLDKEGLRLACLQYEQIEVLRYNLTCVKFCEGIKVCGNETRISEERDCGIINPLKTEPIITNINGECLIYRIVKK